MLMAKAFHSVTWLVAMTLSSVSIFRDKSSVIIGSDVLRDDMVTDHLEATAAAAAKHHDDNIGELGLILLQNNVCFHLS